MLTGLELELTVSECFNLDTEYKAGKLSTATKWVMAEISQWAISRFAPPIEAITKEEIVYAIDNRLLEAGLRRHDSKIKRLKMFHNAVVSEAGIIPQNVRKPQSTLDEMTERKDKSESINRFLEAL